MKTVYSYSIINTPIGLMLAIAHDQALLTLECVQEKNVPTVIDRYQTEFNSIMHKTDNPILLLLQKELDAYFKGILYTFSVPYTLPSTSLFRQKTWSALCSIPYGTTTSYKAIAQKLDNPSAMRAVGGANAKNPIMIIIPCHRVIQANKKIGGYSGGTTIKQWLLKHEAQSKQ